MARYYSATHGRFLTVDRAKRRGKAILSPERWNQYAYVANQPIRYVDPDGRDIEVADSARDSVVEGYRKSVEFRRMLDGAKSNHDVQVKIQLVAPSQVVHGAQAHSTLRVKTSRMNTGGKVVARAVSGTVNVPPGTESRRASLIGHELRHVLDIATAATGVQSPDNEKDRSAGESNADETEQRITRDFNNEADDISEEEAEEAMEGTHPKEERKNDGDGD